MTKTVIVTGAGRGVGRRVAAEFAAKGWNVAAVDVDGPRVKCLAEEIGSIEGDARPLRGRRKLGSCGGCLGTGRCRSMADRGRPGVDGWRIRPFIQGFPRDARRRVGHGGGFEHEGRVSLRQACHSSDAAQWRWAHHQFRIECGQELQPGSWLLLHGGQDRCDRHHASSRQGVCEPRHCREYRGPWSPGRRPGRRSAARS